MISGIYISAAGATLQSSRNDVIANNIANLSTDGFKKQYSIFRVREPEAVELGLPPTRLDARFEGVGGGLALSTVHTDYTEGDIVATEAGLDYAVQGDGFFAVQDENGNVFYTRSGSFTADSRGNLSLCNGRFKVLDETGSIIGVNNDGEPTATPGVYSFADKQKLVHKGETVYADPENTAVLENLEQGSDVQLRRGYLEKSNVSPVRELVNMINGFRTYEANMRAIRNHDTVLGRTVNDIGRVR